MILKDILFGIVIGLMFGLLIGSYLEYRGTSASYHANAEVKSIDGYWYAATMVRSYKIGQAPWESK
jgi:hypothetical protein